MDRGAIRPGILTDASRNDSSPNASTSRNEEHMPGARRKSPPSSDAQPNTSRNDSSAILSRQQDHSQANDTTAAIKNRGRGVLPAKRYHLRSYSTHFASFLSMQEGDLFLSSCNCECILADQVPVDTSCNATDMESSLREEFGNSDLSRMHPRIFSTHPDARRADREELRGLMRLAARNIPIGRLVNCRGELYSGLPRIHTTTVCKIKPNKGFKVRLCLRGDLQMESQVHFASAPYSWARLH